MRLEMLEAANGEVKDGIGGEVRGRDGGCERGMF